MSRQFRLSRPAGFDGGKSTAGRAPFSAPGVWRETQISSELRERVALGFVIAFLFFVSAPIAALSFVIDWTGVIETFGVR